MGKSSSYAVVAIYVRAVVVNNGGRGREASQISSIGGTKGALLCNYSSCPFPSFPQAASKRPKIEIRQLLNATGS